MAEVIGAQWSEIDFDAAVWTIPGERMLAFGLWWLGRVENAARRAGEGYGPHARAERAVHDPALRERATIATEFDPARFRTAILRQRRPVP